MTETILISMPLDELRLVIMQCVNSCIASHMDSFTKEHSNYKGVKEAASFLGKSSNALRIIAHRGQIKHIKKGKSLYFLESDLIEYLESGRKLTPEQLAEGCEAVLVKRKGATK